MWNSYLWIMLPNSVILVLSPLKASTTMLELCVKSILSKWRSATQSNARWSLNPSLALRNTKVKTKCFCKHKTPIHITDTQNNSRLIDIWWERNVYVAFILLGESFFHWILLSVLIPACCCCLFSLLLECIACAIFKSSKKWTSCSISWLVLSSTCWHTFRFLLFQIFHKITAKCSACVF